MKFTCNFLNPDTNERKAITVTLSADELVSVRAIREAKLESAEVIAEAYALSQAYKAMPDGFRHTEPPAPVTVN